MIGCTEYLEMMSAFMDNELDEESRAELSEHLRSCPGCFNASLAYKSINEAIADGEIDPPDTLLPSVFNRIHAHKKRAATRPLRTVGALAAVVVFVIVTVIAAPHLLSGNKNEADSSAPREMTALAKNAGGDVAVAQPEAESSSGLTSDSAIQNDSGENTSAPSGLTYGSGDPQAVPAPGYSTVTGEQGSGTPVEVNGYECSAIIVLDPKVAPPDVFDQYTYYSWQESNSLYLIISGDLYDELIESLDNLNIDYDLELYAEITSEGWILLITSAQ